MISANMRKNYDFVLEIAGIDQLLIQECTLPDVEVAEVMHGAGIGMPDTKTPGKKKVTDFTVKKVMPVEGPDNWVWPWLDLVHSQPRHISSRYAILKMVAPLGPPGAYRTLARYELIELWPKKVTGLSFKREGDGENVMEEIVFSCTNCIKLPEIGI